jgi:NAD(P)-dependent dehydrogenase (short-subunit alcohol dehydrogenase family)
MSPQSISHGFAWTPIVEQLMADLAKSQGIGEREAMNQVLSRQPTGRFVAADEVAALVAFLTSEAAASITGANYAIDCGWTAEYRATCNRSSVPRLAWLSLAKCQTRLRDAL